MRPTDFPNAALPRPFQPATVAPAPAFDASRATATTRSFSALQAEIADFIESGSPQRSVPASNAARDALVAGWTPSEALPGGPAVAAPAVAAGDGSTADFLAAIAPLAQEAGERLGVAPDILVAQAALESGWGRRPLRDAAGADTHNLFGIKGGSHWRGATVDAVTTEVEAGEAVTKTERFRRFDDKAGAFRDLSRLLQGNPRYQSALNVGPDVQAYGEALARGGYATDPQYAAKLAAVVARLRARE